MAVELSRPVGSVCVELAEISPYHAVPDPTEVLRFINGHRHVVSLLVAARKQITNYFDARTETRLEVVRDPDGGEGVLYVVICSRWDVDTTLKHYDALSDAWWIDTMLEARGDIALVVEQA